MYCPVIKMNLKLKCLSFSKWTKNFDVAKGTETAIMNILCMTKFPLNFR